jgi:hypothetical protein
MAETLTINTPTTTEVVKIVQAGPQGPQGPAGSADLSSPPPIGDVVPNSGAFTTISASGLAIFPHIHGSLAGDIYVHVKNTEGTALSRGTPVYVKGNVGDTDRVEVGAADFDDAAKMPAIGLLDQDLLNNGMGDAVILGELPAANTAAYALNQELFVGNAGTLTGTRPTSGIVQSVGIVSRVQSNTGVIVVNMQGTRSPNEAFASSTDPRLTDSRSPTAHASTHHTGGADAITPANIGAAAASHSHAASAIVSGTINIARLPTGTGSTQVALGDHTHTLAAITDTATSEVQFQKVTVVGPLIDNNFPGEGIVEAGTLRLPVYVQSGPMDAFGKISFEAFGGDVIIKAPESVASTRNIALPNASGTLALVETLPAELVIACSDETSNLTTGTAKVTFRMPYAMTLSSVRASVNTAPTGSTLIVDINEAGSTILSTKLSIDASELTSTTAATAAVISDTALADDAEVTIDIDQIGSTIAGKGLKVVLKGVRA